MKPGAIIVVSLIPSYSTQLLNVRIVAPGVVVIKWRQEKRNYVLFLR